MNAAQPQPPRAADAAAGQGNESLHSILDTYIAALGLSGEDVNTSIVLEPGSLRSTPAHSERTSPAQPRANVVLNVSNPSPQRRPLSHDDSMQRIKESVFAGNMAVAGLSGAGGRSEALRLLLEAKPWRSAGDTLPRSSRNSPQNEVLSAQRRRVAGLTTQQVRGRTQTNERERRPFTAKQSKGGVAFGVSHKIDGPAPPAYLRHTGSSRSKTVEPQSRTKRATPRYRPHVLDRWMDG